MFPGAKSLTMPSLREHGSANKLCRVIPVKSVKEFCEKTVELIKSLHGKYNNFIILCEYETLKEIQPVIIANFAATKNVVVIEQYNSGISDISDKIRSLKLGPFVVLTTKEGGIAVDF
jgi:hypothetical protein